MTDGEATAFDLARMKNLLHFAEWLKKEAAELFDVMSKDDDFDICDELLDVIGCVVFLFAHLDFHPQEWEDSVRRWLQKQADRGRTQMRMVALVQQLDTTARKLAEDAKW